MWILEKCQSIRLAFNKRKHFHLQDSDVLLLEYQSLTSNFCFQIYEANNICKIIDASDDPSHWLKFINLARYKIEQNLDVVMMENELYYQVSKDITPGQELLVWYGDSYLKFMGIPVGYQTRPLSCTGKSQITNKGIFILFSSCHTLPSIFCQPLSPRDDKNGQTNLRGNHLA